MENTKLCPKCSEELERCENCDKELCLNCDKGTVQDDDGLCFCAECVAAMNIKTTRPVNVRFTTQFTDDMTFTQAEWDMIESEIDDNHGYIKEHSKSFDLIMDAIKSNPLEWVDEIEVEIEEE